MPHYYKRIVSCLVCAICIVLLLSACLPKNVYDYRPCQWLSKDPYIFIDYTENGYNCEMIIGSTTEKVILDYRGSTIFFFAQEGRNRGAKLLEGSYYYTQSTLRIDVEEDNIFGGLYPSIVLYRQDGTNS